jgi:hypothetical protein
MLIGGMVLRLVGTPLRRSAPRPASESRRAYLGVLGVALGLRPANVDD